MTAHSPVRSFRTTSLCCGTLLLGLGAASAGTVLLAAAPAEAIVYQFDNVTTSFRSEEGLFLFFIPFRYEGTATIVGSFDYLGGTGPGSLGSIGVNFNVSSTTLGATVSSSFSSGYYNAAAQRLVFGLTSGQCPSGSSTCLGIELASGLSNTPFQAVGFVSGQDNMGDYFNSANAGAWGAGDNRNLTATGGVLRAVPAPFLAALLLPFCAVVGYRRRMRRSSNLK